jgi:SOS response regulatory protein OraA/RecX
LYLFLDDTHFSGINKLQQIMRDEIIKKEVKKTVLVETFSNNKLNTEKDDAIDKSKDEVKQSVIHDELTPSKIDQSLLQKTYNRFYYSIITGCLLGYGDIYPISNIAKLMSMTQSFVTISLIIQ